VQPGIYQSGLMIGYDEANRKVTGVFEDASGWNEELKAPQFSCIFYVEGIVDGDTIPVVSYYPGEEDSDTITGTIVRLDAKTLLLRLDDDHGGCWNVSSFSNEPQLFELDQSHTWIHIRYVLKDKAWFYTDKSKSSKQKAYVIKNDFVCVERIEGAWVYCTFYSGVITRGWLRVEDLN
jgi:hypothetical protein